MDEHEAARLLGKLEDVERQEGGKLSNASNQKPYLLFPFLAGLIRDARMPGRDRQPESARTM
jgi:hypothetical protein